MTQRHILFWTTVKRDISVAVDIRTLNADIACIVARQAELRTAIDAIVADLEGAKA
jgi:type I restriction enzyme M protein